MCSHTGPLKLDVAVQRLGWEFDFYAGQEVLARDAGMTMIPVEQVGSGVPFTWPEPEDWLRGGERVRKFGPGK